VRTVRLRSLQNGNRLLGSPVNQHQSRPIRTLKPEGRETGYYPRAGAVRSDDAKPSLANVKISHFEGSKLYQRGPLR
jgi:hypothetical protein